jgi:hypothetical protein
VDYSCIPPPSFDTTAIDNDNARFIRNPGSSISGMTPLFDQVQRFSRLPPAKNLLLYSAQEQKENIKVTIVVYNQDHLDIARATLALASPTARAKYEVVRRDGMQIDLGFAQAVVVAATSNQGSGPLTEFTLFPNLPREIQIQIFSFTPYTIGPRTIKLAVTRTQTKLETEFKPKPYNTIALPVNYRVPAIYQVCSLARKMALRAIPIAFQNAHTPTLGIHFNPSIDTLRLELPSAQSLAKTAIHESSNLVISREFTQHVQLIFDMQHSYSMYRSMADLILRAPHCAWPAIKTWKFPSIGEIGSDGRKLRTVYVVVEAKYRKTLEEAELAEHRHELGRKMYKAVSEKRKTAEAQGNVVGVLAKYIYT